MEIKEFWDYMDTLQEEFPLIDRKSLNSVILHGLVQLSGAVRSNLDVYMSYSNVGRHYYFGRVSSSNEELVKRHRETVRKAIRYRYRKTGSPFTGYYLSLTDEQFDLYKESKPIPEVYLFRIEDEAGVYKKGRHLFRISGLEPSDLFLKHNDYTISDNAEYLACRNEVGVFDYINKE